MRELMIRAHRQVNSTNKTSQVLSWLRWLPRSACRTGTNLALSPFASNAQVDASTRKQYTSRDFAAASGSTSSTEDPSGSLMACRYLNEFSMSRKRTRSVIRSNAPKSSKLALVVSLEARRGAARRLTSRTLPVFLFRMCAERDK